MNVGRKYAYSTVEIGCVSILMKDALDASKKCRK